MIDMHVHAVDPQLPGAKSLPSLLDEPPTAILQALRAQVEASKTEIVLGMGHLGGVGDDPLGIASTLQAAKVLPRLFAIGAADPTRTDADHLQRVESQLRSGQVVALKGYLGYLHHGPDSPGYIPYLELAERYQLPFIFHTGDTWSTAAKVKYAHPLLIDEVAVDYRNVKFVMAHFGNPWLMDAAEVIYKNDNVWADLSAILVGDRDDFRQLQANGFLKRTIERVRYAVDFADRSDRFLYGTDWPLTEMDVYPAFVEQLFTEGELPAVFHDNAASLFKLHDRAM